MNPSHRTSENASRAAGPILLCFDGSRDASHAIDVAARLLSGRKALVLSVWTPAADMTPLDPLGDVVGRFSGLYEEMDSAASDLTQIQAAEGVTIARRAGFEAKSLTARGKPAPEIVRVADELDAACVVLGARGVGALSSSFPGSVPTKVVQHCSRPVLIIPQVVD
jgi:nucleotide-binding universal stress UspA family protein